METDQEREVAAAAASLCESDVDEDDWRELTPPLVREEWQRDAVRQVEARQRQEQAQCEEAEVLSRE
eukprot:11264133-Alexandrium_andersonii.AAC.1